ncbi:cis-golgi transport vesicle tethering complex subunit [Sistotremastrum suecicum HHB10207 ss-3]|uniref:Conserved oligomeric Golgi complex subunit 3 n=1 Tax=Sistotremastrum suecicum HHB10207 ss-3 TaxID=1314776 RepID=A0A166HAI7_9AGAM|nr:cis-golgi transport vesicle tethering complex subunit [Sistotremastrum suecicum HHB10207 ss-3]
MSVPRVNSPRSGPSNRVAPQPAKPTISFEQWESEATLNEPELKSINLLKQACEQRRPLLKSAEADNSRPSTPVGAKLAPGGHGSRPSTPGPGGQHRHQNSLHPKNIVATPQQFHDWFALVERSVLHSQEAHFHAHVANISEYLATCDQLLQRTQSIKDDVDSMIEGWSIVEEGGKSLQQACERVLDEKEALIEQTNNLSSRLEYFQELEATTRLLNQPGESLVLEPDFLLMVERVDVCLEFLRAHPQYREAEIYSLRFQQCLIRAMTLIKMFFVGYIKAQTADISKRLIDVDSSQTVYTHLVYSRFKSQASTISPLLMELERRARDHPADLESLLKECRTAYFAARRSLVVGHVVEEIKGLHSSRSDLVSLTREGCGFLRQLCSDEFGVYRRFFRSGVNEIYDYLEVLCDLLYDELRPRILHESKLATLCQVCTVLQALMVQDISTSVVGLDLAVDSSETDEESESYFAVDHPNLDDSLDLSRLLQTLLQDAQTRLFFKAQAFIQSDIKNYVPREDDLVFTTEKSQARSSVDDVYTLGSGGIMDFITVSGLKNQSTWYPALRRMMWVLSQLQDFIQPAIFNDIAHEAVSVTLQSIISASNVLLGKNNPESYRSGLLFLVRHLLILKEVSSGLDLAVSDAGTGSKMPGIYDTLGSILKGTSTFLLPGALLPSSSSPDLSDVRQGIDQALKNACEKLIESCSDQSTIGLRAFMERCNKYLKDTGPAAKRGRLSEQEFAKPDKLKQVESEFLEATKREVPIWVAQLRQFLESDVTVSILLPPLQSRLASDYAAFRDLVSLEYPSDYLESLMTMSDLWTVLKHVSEIKPS